MSSVHRSPEFRPMLDDDMARNATPILDALADKLGQSCQLAVRTDDGFCIVLQSTPAEAFFVNMPLGLLYLTPESAASPLVRGGTTYHPNPALPDVTDVCAAVFRGSDQVALVIAPLVKGRRSPSLEHCLHEVQVAAHSLNQSFVMKALVA